MTVDEREGETFVVAEPLSYGLIAPPQESGGEDDVAKRAADPYNDPEDQRREPSGLQAVLVIHGMGQQATFDTLSEVADGLASEQEQQSWHLVEKRARRVRIGEETLSRIELVTTDGTVQREVHLYEAYWAPLTEGRVTLRDVIKFLLGAGIGGLRRRTAEFRRWSFGDMQPYRPVQKTPVYLMAALAIVGALILIDTVVGATAVRSLWRRGDWQSPLLRDLNLTMSFLAATMTSFGAALFAGNRWKRLSPPGDRFGVVLGLVGWLHAAVVALVLIAAAGHSMFLVAINDGKTSWWQRTSLPLGHVALATLAVSILAVGAIGFTSLARTALTARWVLRLAIVSGALSIVLPFAAAMGWTSGVGPITGIEDLPWAWVLVVVATLVVRRLLVEYLGDVAAYVSPQTLDKFCELREEIRKRVFDAGKAVYGATRDGKTPIYAGVTVVGHSLGSVAAYDLLNRLILEDEFKARTSDVRSRTNALITFGSPLDKTAYLFSLHHPRDTAYALAATVQPMIASYDYRPYRWINIYSRHDIISGGLDYYDRPGSRSTRRVENEPDWDCTIPLLAHVEYWNNRLLWNRVLGSFSSVVRYEPVAPKRTFALLSVPDPNGA